MVGVWEAAIVFAAAVVLAHQGDWDEMLLVATPVGIFAGLLWVTNCRADGANADDRDHGRPDDRHRDRDHGRDHGRPRPAPES